MTEGHGEVVRPAADPAAPGPMRASDQDREATAERIRAACVEGRLTLEEMAERIEQAYTAKTLEALSPLTADLPSPASGGAPTAAPLVVPDSGQPTESYVAIFGGSERKGRWRVPRRSRAVAVFGGVQLDLRQAQLTAPTVDIDAVAVFGGIEITVPEGVEVRLTGWAIFGGKSARVPDVRPGAPVVRVKAVAVFGGVDVRVQQQRAAVPGLGLPRP